MRGSKGITHIEICQIGQLFGEFFSVFSLFLAPETGILKQNHISFFHGLHSLCGSLAGHIIIAYEHHFLAQLLGQSLCYRSQGLLLVGAFLHFAQMRAEDHLAAVIDQLLNGRQSSHNPCLICDFAVFQRHIEITSHQYSLPFCVDVINRFLIQTHFNLHTESLKTGVRSNRPDPAGRNVFTSSPGARNASQRNISPISPAYCSLDQPSSLKYLMVRTI